MAKILPDGTVVPSFIPLEVTQAKTSRPGEHDFGLKIGTVTKIFFPDDDGNIRKNRIEYDVKVGERDGRKGFNISVYKNCVCSDIFGGIADSLEWTYRQSDDGDNPNALYQTGSKVLILCLNGDTNGGVIVGGIRHIRRKKVSNRARGHFLEFEFNGINIEVNQDGELILTYKSKTDLQGLPQDPATGGSFIKIDKTGSIEANDLKGTRIRIDKATSDITIETTTGNVVVNAEQSIRETAKQAIRESADKSFVANAPAMKIGGDGASEPLVLGNIWKAFYNLMVTAQLNPLIAKVAALSSAIDTMVSTLNSHKHDGVTTGLGTSNAPTSSISGDPTPTPSPAPVSSPAQYSDFVKTKKTYQK